MDRDAFIAECVHALHGLAVANGSTTEDPAVLYERLSYDFPEFSADDLSRVLTMVYDALSEPVGGLPRDGSSDKRLPPVLQLLLGARASPSPALRGGSMAPRGTVRDPESALATVFDTLREKAQSSSDDVPLWQQLYGAHVFAMLASSPEEVLEAQKGAISYHGLTNASIWKGRFVTVIQEQLNRMIGDGAMPSARKRWDAALGVLNELVLCSRSSEIATAVFSILLDVCVSGSASSRDVQARVARMVGAACLTGDHVVTQEVARRTLFELVGPVLEDVPSGSRRSDPHEQVVRVMMLMAGSVCLEHIVHHMVTKRDGRGSARQDFESTMIRRGVWRHMVSSMAQIDLAGQYGVPTRLSLARALVMTSAYSDELRAWSLRVPGYATAWEQHGVDDRDSRDDRDCGDDREVDMDTTILLAAWSTLNTTSDKQEPRHVRFLREIFCAEGPRRLTPDNAENALRALELTERLCRALEVSDAVYGGDRDILRQIEQTRAAVAERILAAEAARPVRGTDDDGNSRRLSTLPEVERLRRVDRMLKGLGEVAAGGMGGSRKND